MCVKAKEGHSPTLMPARRPLVWNTCQVGCNTAFPGSCERACQAYSPRWREIAHSVVKSVRDASVACALTQEDRRCNKICEPFANRLPRPLLENACIRGCVAADKETCTQAAAGLRNALEHVSASAGLSVADLIAADAA